jgi:hypothetical protein
MTALTVRLCSRDRVSRRRFDEEYKHQRDDVQYGPVKMSKRSMAIIKKVGMTDCDNAITIVSDARGCFDADHRACLAFSCACLPSLRALFWSSWPATHEIVLAGSDRRRRGQQLLAARQFYGF